MFGIGLRLSNKLYDSVKCDFTGQPFGAGEIVGYY